MPAVGVEVAGLVMAVFPILMGGLEYYRLIKGSTSLRKTITKIRRDIEVQQIIFRSEMERLLEDLDIAPAISKTDVAWTNDSTAAALKEKLSDSYSALIHVLNAIHSCLDEAQKELSKIDRKSRSLLPQRLMSASKKLENLTDQLRGHNQDLITLNNHNHDHLAPRRRKREGLPNLAKSARLQAETLFETLNQTDIEGRPVVKQIFLWSFLGISHSSRCRILIPSDNLFDSQSTVGLDSKLISLELEFAQEGRGLPTSSASLNLDLANADQSVVTSDHRVLSHQEPSPRLVSETRSFNQRETRISTDRLSEKSSTPPRKRVQFQVSTREEESPQLHYAAEIDSEVWPTKSIRFSDLAGELQRLPESKPSFDEDAAVLIERADIIPLSGLLDGPARLSTSQRRIVAASLAWDLVFLIDTPWTKHGLMMDDIFFARRNGEISVSEPLINHKFRSARKKPDTDIATSLQAPMLWFGKILIELGYGLRLSELRPVMESLPLQPEMSDFVMLSGLVDSIYSECGIRYGDVVRRCIVSMPFDQNVPGEMQGFLYDKIVLPLRADVSDFFESTIPPKSVSFLQVGGVCQPPPKLEGLEKRAAILQPRKDPSSIRPFFAALNTLDLLLLHEHISRVSRMCHDRSLVFAPAVLEVKDLLSGIEEALAIINGGTLNDAEEPELLGIFNDCYTNVSSLEDLVQEDQTGVNKDILDQLTIKLKLSATSLTLFNGRYTVETSGPSNSDTISETGLDSILDEHFDGTASSATSFMEPVWADEREVANEFLKLIKHDSLLGPLLASVVRRFDIRVATNQLRLLFQTYSRDLLGQVAQQPYMEASRMAAKFIARQIPYLVDRISTDYVMVNQDMMLEQLLYQIPGERKKEKEDRTAEITRTINKNIETDGKPPGDLRSHGMANERRGSLLSVTRKPSDTKLFSDELKLNSIEPGERLIFATVKDSLVSGRAFGKFRLAVRNLIQQEPLDIVRQEVFSGFTSSDETLVLASITAQWNLREFLKTEFDAIQSLAPMLTVTGGPLNAIAATCTSYLNWAWPESVHSNHEYNLVDGIMETIETGSYESVGGYLRMKEVVNEPASLDYNLDITIIGSKGAISLVAQQLVWLSSVFRVTTTDHPCLSEMDFMWTNNGSFELRPGKLTVIEPESDICWHSLLGKAVIASRFPIPPRDGEVGLEIPFQSLVRLSKVTSQMEYGNQVALYGSSSLLYPTSLGGSQSNTKNPPSCIQWHLIADEQPHISAGILAECNSWLSIESNACLPDARNIVGYCKAACIHVGTKDFEYARTEESGLPGDESMPGVKIKSITVGTSGMGIFGVQAAVDIVHSRSLEISPQIDKYDDILDTTRKMSIILYDPGEQRGWLIPAHNVLLHMAQSWIRKHKPTVQLPYAEPETAGGNEAEKILTESYKLLLKKLLDDDSEWYLRDLIKQIWRDLQGCLIARKQRKAEDRENQTVPSSRLHAWEFLDFIDRPAEFCLRKETLNFLGCGWEALAEDNEIMILACRGLGEVIRPAQSVHLCREWSHVPPQRNFLAASISCMHLLPHYFVGGPCMQLTRRVFWRPSAEDLLDDCSHDGQTICVKAPQRLITNPVPSPISALAFPPGGAVVFGVKKLHKMQTTLAVAPKTLKKRRDPEGGTKKKSKWKVFSFRQK